MINLQIKANRLIDLTKKFFSLAIVALFIVFSVTLQYLLSKNSFFAPTLLHHIITINLFVLLSYIYQAIDLFLNSDFNNTAFEKKINALFRLIPKFYRY